MTDRKAVLFDLDGTLLDTLDDLSAAVNYALGMHGYPARSRGEVRSFVGNGIRRLIERSLPDIQEEGEVISVLEDFRRYYQGHLTDFTRPYPGVVELLKALKAKGVPTAVVTNKFEAGAAALTDACLAGLVDLTIGEGGRFPAKPAPDGVHFAMEQLEVTQAVYVGDSPVDAETARRAGIPCILVDWGFSDRETLAQAGADDLCSDARELLTALNV